MKNGHFEATLFKTSVISQHFSFQIQIMSANNDNISSQRRNTAEETQNDQFNADQSATVTPILSSTEEYPSSADESILTFSETEMTVDSTFPSPNPPQPTLQNRINTTTSEIIEIVHRYSSTDVAASQQQLQQQLMHRMIILLSLMQRRIINQ